MEWIWLLHYLKGNSLQKLLGQVALAATIYWIWAARNEAMYGDTNTRRPLFMLITKDVEL
ncbi:hypothetical protein FRX31_018847 [Thalictrum thalictroides]|uniref:Uncharacterized protein n=1 Tax=Thalictrum thalictroides TaxID=46969 RepID=A0A7J6W2G7_THATH|nr:hypothetical protein FRX31_018847 [Thalictrum thalictroides]